MGALKDRLIEEQDEAIGHYHSGFISRKALVDRLKDLYLSDAEANRLADSIDQLRNDVGEGT